MDLLSAAYNSDDEELQVGEGAGIRAPPPSCFGDVASSNEPLPLPSLYHSPPTSTTLMPDNQGREGKEKYSSTSGSTGPVGYVSKRKRKAPDPPRVDSEDRSSFSANILSSYSNVQPLESPTNKQARYGARIPKFCGKVLKNHAKPVLSLEWHPCDPRLLLSASLDGGVRLWDVEKDGRCLATYGLHGAAVRDVEWATNETALSAGYDRAAVYMDVGYSREIVRLVHSAYVSVVKTHPLDRNLVLTGDFDGKLQLWDLREPSKCTKLYKGAGGKILDIAFLPKCDAFVASADIVRKNAFSQSMNVWDLDSGVTLVHQLYFEPFTCPCLKAHRFREEFLAQSNGDYIVLFSAKKPFKLNKRKRFQGHFVSGFDVGFDTNSDGSVLCSASSEGKVHFYDYFSSKPIHALTLTDAACLAVTWSQCYPFRMAVSDWKGNIHILQ